MFKITRNSLVIIFALLILIPLLFVVMTTLKKSDSFYVNPTGWPKSPSLSNYFSIILQENLQLNFMNSVIVTVATVFLGLLCASMISYAIIRITGWKSGFLYSFFILGMMLPAQVNMIPLYGVMDYLKLTNSLPGLVLVTTTLVLPVAVFIIGGFMKSLSHEMIESSAIDGASEWIIYQKIALPLSLPALATSAIFAAVISWNDLLYPLLFVNNNSLKTLPLALLDFRGEYLTNYPMLFSGVLLASIPICIFYVFFQRYFVAGMTAGATKG